MNLFNAFHFSNNNKKVFKKYCGTLLFTRKLISAHWNDVSCVLHHSFSHLFHYRWEGPGFPALVWFDPFTDEVHHFLTAQHIPANKQEQERKCSSTNQSKKSEGEDALYAWSSLFFIRHLMLILPVDHFLFIQRLKFNSWAWQFEGFQPASCDSY